MSLLTRVPARGRRASLPKRRARRGAHAAPLAVPRGTAPRPAGDLQPRAALAAAALLPLAALPLPLLIPRGLWLDEAISVHQPPLGLPELIQTLAQTDRHPPLHGLSLWATIRLLGDSDLAVRAPSIVAGTLVVPALYALGRELYDRRTGVAAALLGAVAPVLVWYSQ